MDCDPPELFARIYARHGHRCPMSTLGGRLGLAAMACFAGTTERLQALYSHRTCALDGIAEVTGCSEETGTLVVKNTGHHALVLSSPRQTVELALTDTALEMAGRYRLLCGRLEQNWADLGPDEQARRRGEMDALLDELLPRFWLAEEALLVKRLAGDIHA